MVCKGEEEVLKGGNSEGMIKYLVGKGRVVRAKLFEGGEV